VYLCAKASRSQKAGRLADNPKRQSLVGGGLERATVPFSGFQRAEPFGGYEVEKKSSERLPWIFSGIEGAVQKVYVIAALDTAIFYIASK